MPRVLLYSRINSICSFSRQKLELLRRIGVTRSFYFQRTASLAGQFKRSRFHVAIDPRFGRDQLRKVAQSRRVALLDAFLRSKYPLFETIGVQVPHLFGPQPGTTRQGPLACPPTRYVTNRVVVRKSYTRRKLDYRLSLAPTDLRYLLSDGVECRYAQTFECGHFGFEPSGVNSSRPQFRRLVIATKSSIRSSFFIHRSLAKAD
jgi:hypothetical protein